MKTWPYENVYYRLKDGEPYLIGSRCKNCNFVAFPKKVICPACVTRGNMVETELTRTGKVDTYSVLHVGAPGFPVPYVVGYVKMVEGPRIFSIIHQGEISDQPIEIGAHVKLILGKIRDDEQGNELMGFQFRTVNNDKGAAR
ncbi:OB-fold domain-containing protein [uncultured Desulfosarcina sp.]|uniref:Zn-ribbon domain-containing OB-fold protein n=1 Tax=uncultured Desulfosarcina sp. TaxID=218289 RepID=UPI0029C636A4|nr:OB-fold domain-containing protein [uncultured Desulfosarcina sp.]